MSSLVEVVAPAFEHAQQPIVDAVPHFYRIITQNPLADEVRSGMSRLRLDKMRGEDKRNAMDLFDESKIALDRPTTGEGSPVAVLIPLRECVNTILSELLRRRPVQEEASKVRDKVASIGGHCGRPGLSTQHFERLADNAHGLIDELSGGKQSAISRDSLINLHQKSVLLIKALLDSVDETKLRP
jgi:hypothetical protein